MQPPIIKTTQYCKMHTLLRDDNSTFSFLSSRHNVLFSVIQIQSKMVWYLNLEKCFITLHSITQSDTCTRT